MGCLLAVLPRLAVIFIWLARPIYFDQAIGSALVAVIGILFLPFTTWWQTRSTPATVCAAVTFGIVVFAHRSHFRTPAAPSSAA